MITPVGHARQSTEVTCKAPGRTRVPCWNPRRRPAGAPPGAPAPDHRPRTVA
ncbi:hypothetical protein HMPREF1550_00368, partial [Actinomyces sp. oral taxon 877 str. F0543]